MFSQKPKLIWSVTSDGLTNIYKWRVSLNIIQLEQLERLRSEDTPRRLMIHESKQGRMTLKI